MTFTIRPTEEAAMKHAKRIAEAARMRMYGRAICEASDDPLLIEVGIELQENADALLKTAYDEWDILKDRTAPTSEDDIPF